jgi:hypothetical protein
MIILHSSCCVLFKFGFWRRWRDYMKDELIHNISPITLHCVEKFNSVDKWAFNFSYSDWHMYSVYPITLGQRYEAAKCTGSETPPITHVLHNAFWSLKRGGSVSMFGAEKMPLLRLIQLTDKSSSLTVWLLVALRCWSWSGRPRPTTLQPPRSNVKTRGS